jgi:hypothetical protein
MARKKSLVVSRALTKDWKKAIDRHALLVGQIVWASNTLHTYLHLAFLWAVGDDDMGKALWHQQRNDGPQRELLLAALEANKTITDADRQRLIWATKKAVKLAELRNDLVHLHMAPIAASRRPTLRVTLIPGWVGVPKGRLIRTSRPGWGRSLPLLRGDILALGRYVAAVWYGIASNAPGEQHHPLPRRPRLRLIPEDKATKPPKNPTQRPPP